MSKPNHQWLLDLIKSHAQFLEFYEQMTGTKSDDATALDGYKVMREALEALDIGECDSGGDYHSSAIGRHCNPVDGGKSECPACLLREMMK
jgi:hypothetical protein